MMKYISTLVRAAAASVLLATGANAATIPFTINSAGSSVEITNCDDLLCVAEANLSPIAGNPIINATLNGPATVFNFILFTPVIDFFGPDSFDIEATLAFSAPSASFTSNGQGTGFTTRALGRFFSSGEIIWDAIAPQQIDGVGIVTVAFLNSTGSIFGAGGGGGNDPRRVITQASISVIPLPAGILLLGSALLGIFGLSRRRKLASA